MTQFWMESFDQYGEGDAGRANALNGAWDEISGNVTFVTPAFGARTGSLCLRGDALSNDARRALGSDVDTLIVGLAYRCDALPDDAAIHRPMYFRSSVNANICYLTVRPDGALEARNSADTIIGVTTGPVINAGSWQHIEMKAFVDTAGATGTLEVRVDEVVVLDLSNLTLGAALFSIFAVNQGGGISDPNRTYWDDIVVRDDAGAFNNDFEGDVKVATLQPVANGANQGWTTRALQKLGVGVLEVPDTNTFYDRNSGVLFLDDPAFEIGVQDFCIECFARWSSDMITTEVMNLMAKFNAVGDQASWRLYVNGPDNGNEIVFETSTDGTLGDIVEVHAQPFIPLSKRWYHFAVAREAGVSRLYIDGVRIGGDQADARAYFNGTAEVSISGLPLAASEEMIENSSLDGWMDGVRFTVGAARYTAVTFVPPTDTLPTDVGGDPLWANVELLLNFDTTIIVDESANAFPADPTPNIGDMANVIFPDDLVAYMTIDGESPTDFDFVEAELIAARGILTFSGQPLDTETVTVDAVTYTFLTIFVDAANNILIGADAGESLGNLRAAINQEAGAGTKYGTATVFNPTVFAVDQPGDLLLAIARTPGAAGNALATTETLTNGSWAAATLLGGLDIPTNSEFTLGALPPDVTGIKAIAVVVRAFKSDNGASEFTASFVKDGPFVAAGTARPLSTTPTYYEDTIEADPETAGALTPSTLINSRIRLDRTA